ncbi:hypothetical protein XELAEV_18033749mg [Xenopus laevis]|uniref:Aspartyl/asparaginyl beta-hydroxylase n=1 Tax=Xenopus laevis TaxID=8355 RepID=A0A974HE89_XENLA|nr:hypothetical protein XELAEV_18033749mg [Xenopus laevis]
MSKSSSSQRKNPKGGKKVNGGKNGKKEGLSGSSFFTWFMVIALLGVWTSVAVVWLDLVDYEEVLGKLGIYDTDGDGDFDVDDAKILLGLKERSVVVPPAEDTEDDHPATQATTEPEDDVEEDIQDITNDILQPQDEAADDLDKDLEEIFQDSLHAEEDVSETHEETDQDAEYLEPDAEEQDENEQPETEKEVEAVETANIEAVLAEEQQEELEAQEGEQPETTDELPETEEVVDNFVEEPETESNEQELNEDVNVEPTIAEMYQGEPSAIEEPEPQVTEEAGHEEDEAEPEEEREEQEALDDNQETEHEPETLQKEETPSESAEELHLDGTIVDVHVNFEQVEEHHTVEEPQHLEEERLHVMKEQIEEEEEHLQVMKEQIEEEEELLHVMEEQIEEGDHPVEGGLDEAAFEQLQPPAEKAPSEPEETNDLQTEEVIQDDKAEESISVSEEQQKTSTDESVVESEQNTKKPAEVAELPNVPAELIKLPLKRRADWQQLLAFPDNVTFRNDLGVDYLLLGDNNNVLAMAPIDGFAKVHYGFILKAENNIVESIPYLKLWEPETDDGRFYFHLGVALQKVGRQEIKYSVMHPGTHAGPHTGPTNCRLRMHLGLVIPKEGCRMSWEEGKVLIFDDSFECEIWQEASSYCLIFIVDFWHPELTPHQRRTLPAI